jgi:hypothetical protein
MENNNLYEIFQLLLQEYQDDIERKGRLQSKAIGYLTTLSIILAVSVAVMIFSIKEVKYGSLIYVLLLLTFFAQFYFSLWTFFFSFRAYEKRKSYFPSAKDYIGSWNSPKDEFLGGINKTLMRCIKEHKKMLKDLLFNVEMCRLFLYISFTSFVIFCIIFLIFLLGGT